MIVTITNTPNGIISRSCVAKAFCVSLGRFHPFLCALYQGFRIAALSEYLDCDKAEPFSALHTFEVFRLSNATLT
jgi:hypothetical protein